MCGIAGIVRITPAGDASALTRPHHEAIPEHWLDTLDAGIKHRGPDGQGRFRDRSIAHDGTIVDVALVHRRLSIIDLAYGSQPMVLRVPIENRARSVSEGAVSQSHASPTSKADHSLTLRALKSLPPPLLFQGAPDSRVEYRELQVSADDDLIATVFNGCIYNHRALRAELSALGHQFASDHSDTEVLLHGHRAWQADLQSKLRGMYALGLWDRRRAKLTLMRDEFGEKPLHFAFIAEAVLAFASTPAGLVELALRQRPPGTTNVDATHLRHWAAFGYHPLLTPIEGLTSLPRSSCAVPERHQAEQHFELQVSIEPDTTPTSKLRQRFTEPWKSYLERTLDTSVREKLEADTPIACFLSGGVDSSLIATLASRHVKNLTTICVRMPSARYDESGFANQVATILGTRHLTIDAPGDPACDLVALIESLGLPFGDSSLLPTFWAARAARTHAKVMLAGDGGDELFNGYERYAISPWLPWLCPVAWLVPTGILDETNPKSRSSKLARLVRAARHMSYSELLALFPRHQFHKLMPDQLWPGPAFLNDPPPGTSACEADLDSHLPGDLLRKVDHASMLAGIEVRCPFLDRDVRHVAEQLRASRPFAPRKHHLRSLARKYLPASIIDRPKMGFAIPIGEWFRSDFGGMKTLLLDHLHAREPFGPEWLGIKLNVPYVHQLIDEHMGEQRDHAQRLYWLLVLSIWARWMVKVRAASQPAG